MLSSEAITVKPPAKEYAIHRLTRDNLQDVARLHGEVYNMPAPGDYYSGKYETTYTGIGYTGFIAYNKQDLPVAYYGVIPCFIQYGTQIILAAQSADKIKHPLHRYKGMFVELSTLTFELCRELGITLIFGFPNQQSYHGAVNKLGWKMTETMDRFLIPVRTFPLEAIAQKIKGLQKLYKLYRQFILSRYKTGDAGIANAVTVEGFAGLWRSDDYLAYKTYSKSYVLKIGSAKIWMSNKNGMLIGDMEGINESNFTTVINKIKRLARLAGIREINFHCSPGTSLHRLFAAQYKAITSYPVLFQDFGSPILPAKIKFTFADIDVF